MAKRYGVGIVVCALVLGAAMAVPAGQRLDGSRHTLYPMADWIFLAGLAIAGALIAAGRGPVRVATVIGCTCATQLAGMGIFAVKHTGQAIGSGYLAGGHADRLRLAAGVLALAGLLAAGLCLLVLRDSGVLAGPVSPVRQSVSVLAGALVLLVLPLALSIPATDRRDITSLVGYLVLFALPWAFALVLACSLAADAALWSVATVVGSALLQFAAPRVAVRVVGWSWHGGPPLLDRADLSLVALAMAVPILVVAGLAGRDRQPGRAAAR